MKILSLWMLATLFALPASAINLQEFQQVIQRGEAQRISHAFEEVLKSDSPELIMRARATLMHSLPDTLQRTEMLERALEKTLTLTPVNAKDTLWVANAHYIKAEQMAEPEEKFNHLKEATLLGHDKAPEEMASLIASKQPEKARDLLKLSLLRGNYGAAITYARLDGNPAKKAELVRILQDMASKGDGRARRTLNELKKEPL
jgi:hypothetical protein